MNKGGQILLLVSQNDLVLMSFPIRPEGEINQFNQNVVQYYAFSFCGLAGLQLHYVQELSMRLSNHTTALEHTIYFDHISNLSRICSLLQSFQKSYNLYSCRMHPEGTSLISASFEEIIKYWHTLYNGSLWENLFSIINI